MTTTRVCLEYPAAHIADIEIIHKELVNEGFTVIKWFNKTSHIELSPFPCVNVEGDSEKLMNYLFNKWKFTPEVHERRRQPRKESHNGLDLRSICMEDDHQHSTS